ncbi:putative aminotransferase YcbU [Flexivirga endophytica]|uniref:Aminotransferase YcbU n=1 Tax=Flexivirga endophytica TaxID=1849103 RepID=A0A916T4J8_9MICO|nr:aminotransferase class V-fold PLP-dependent enzyme [Flexivirga endophytica]GGB31200.1 putative aminotransferase YcbU [Flexivirga endophytica]GHB52136.1 putative aminotransferase YcbU [Flexivirga endophytica]
MTDQPTPAEFRARFPGLHDTVHLASCSQGALSDRVAAAMLDFQHSILQHGAPWDLWMAKVAQARAAFARLIGADVDEIAVVSSASEAAYQVASTQDWSRCPRIVTTDMEFPSVAHVWLAQRSRGGEVEYVADHDGVVDADDYIAEIDERSGLVSVPLISYRNGLRLPVREVAAHAHAQGAKVFVDAYQGLGVEPVNVDELGCDYLACGSLKYLLGIPGIAFLYVRAGTRDDVAPSMTGWFGRANPFAFDPRTIDYPDHARRFETGTPSIPSAYGAVAGLEMLELVDPHVIRDHLGQLTRSLHGRLAEAGETLWSPADDSMRGPQVALRCTDPDDLNAYLKERRIFASPRGDVIRMSFHYYNDESDVTAVVRAIAAYRAVA